MKIWTRGSSPRCGSRNAWKRIKNINGASRLYNFWNFFGAIQIISCRAQLVTTDETWLYHYDPETKQQSMEWRHSGSPRPPKNPSAKIRREKFSPRFLGIKTASSSMIIVQRAKLSTRSITHLYWCKWRTFWRESVAGSSPKWSYSCTTMPRLTGHLRPRRNWPTWASNVLITHPILQIWPRRTTTCSLDWKKKLKGRHFSSDAEDIAAAETWLDGQYFEFFFEWLCKS